MKIPKKTFDLFLLGGASMSLAGGCNQRMVQPEKILFSVRTTDIPGMEVRGFSKFPRYRVFQHLAVKGLLDQLNRREKELLRLSIVGLREIPYLFFRVLLQHNDENQKVKLAILNELISEKYQFPLIPPEPRRFYRSFEPELLFNKRFVDKPRFPPKRYIGVGHSDSGSISTAPSWMEQQSDNGEDSNLEDERLICLLQRFLTSPPSPA